MSRRSLAHAVLVAVMFGGAAAAQDRPNNEIPCAAINSIGTADMANDGTITLHLRSLWPNDPVAEAELTYAPNDPQYEDIKRHLGGISPGQPKQVQPWC